MKKVLVLAAAIALFATPAMALIQGTKHDFRSTNSNATVKSDQSKEICVYCHTPHGAKITDPNTLPLWNRSHIGKTYAATELYNSTTLNQTVSAPTVVLSKVNASDAKLCMSCHDGASLDGGLQNPANSESGVQPNFTPNTVGSNANIGGDTDVLKNDHPIGMVYNTVAAISAEELVDGATMPLPKFDGGVMWCSTCHDVHDNSKGTPFLNTTNAGSNLCLECHIK